MAKQIITFVLSFLTPGLGYLQIGDRKNFFVTIFGFFTVIISGIAFRFFTTFQGLTFVIVALLAIYLFAALHSTLKAKYANTKICSSVALKLISTISFFLITGLSFANRRTLMGFDIMSMDVRVMEPSVLQGDKFLVDTWIYKNDKPKKGDVVAHSFDGQKGLYLNRIVGVENDIIEIENGIVVVNGQALTEPYVLSLNVTRPESKDMKKLTVPPEHYFVMGDNRDASFGDSRFSGTITIDNIEGKITDIISSRNRSSIGITVK